MQFLPNTALPPKKSKTGIVRGRSRGLFWLRARANVINPRSNQQALWRQIFGQAKRNWLSIGPGGANNAPTGGIDPQDAWGMAAALYFGIVQPGYIVDGVVAESVLIGCSSWEAFQVMVQTTRAALGLPSAPTPVIVSTYLSFPDGSGGSDDDPYAIEVTGPTAPDYSDPSIALQVTFTTADTTDPPGTVTASGTNLTTSVTPLAQTQTPGTVFSGLSCAVSANGTYWIYGFDLDQNFGNLIGLDFSATGFDVADFNVTNAVIVNNTANEITIANGTVPAETDTGGSGTCVNPGISTWACTIYVSPTPDTPLDTNALDINWTAYGFPAVFSIALEAINGDPSPAFPPPTFPFPFGLYCATEYDLDYNITGFSLSYSANEVVNFPMKRGINEVPGIWLVYASPATTSSYSTPAASSLIAIVRTGPYMPGPAAILAAWGAVFGPLPDSGDIYFSASYCDPESGCPGPTLSCTGTWQKGTLKGYDSRAWAGPNIQIGAEDAFIGGAAPGTYTQDIVVSGFNGYTGTLTFAVKSKTVLPNGAGTSTRALPPGATFSFAPPTLTIAPGDVSDHTIVLSVVLVSGATQFAGPISAQASDGLLTLGVTLELTVSGDTTPQLPDSYLSASPGSKEISVAAGGSATFTYTAYNSGTEDIFVVLLAEARNGQLGFSFAPTGLTVPAQSGGTPGSATSVCTITAPSGATTGESDAQIEFSAGNYSVYGFIVITVT